MKPCMSPGAIRCTTFHFPSEGRKLVGLLTCLLLIATLAVAQPCRAQEDSQAASLPDEPTPQQPSSIAAPQVPTERNVSWKLLGPNLLHDQKDIWLFPVSAARGHHFAAVLVVVGVTAGLIALDKPMAQGFRDTQAFKGLDRAFSGGNTWLGTESVLPAFYFVGLIRKDSYAQHTALLAAEAFFDANVVSLVMEDASHRLLPYQVPVNGNLSDTWFDSRHHGYRSYLTGAGGFPSGHTISAFSIATVIAERYPNPSWHRWVIYGIAGLVGFSRLSGHSHFPSDVFLGAALGYTISRSIVLRPSKPLPDMPDAP